MIRRTWRKVSSSITPEFQNACIVIGARRLRVWAYVNPSATPAEHSQNLYQHNGKTDNLSWRRHHWQIVVLRPNYTKCCMLCLFFVSSQQLCLSYFCSQFWLLSLEEKTTIITYHITVTPDVTNTTADVEYCTNKDNYHLIWSLRFGTNWELIQVLYYVFPNYPELLPHHQFPATR